ncbi:MAG: class I SAM-dependent methyltransferase [Magnetococcales bacterium]|nr:class I SAM-dependent methyltransferase [Magnetococcales bacterium]
MADRLPQEGSRVEEAQRLSVEREVLRVYQEENPSTRFLESDERLREEERRRVLLFRDYLKLPPRLFRGASLLDLGCGTGEHAIFYSRWGADCTLVEMNPLALERARKIFALRAPREARYRFVERSLFDYDPGEERFDIVACEGVLHHTGAKEAGFERLAACLKPGGFLILAICTRAGMFQRDLQRLVIRSLAREEAEIPALAERLFRENIDRAERFGRRSRAAIIQDTYVNPKIDCPCTGEVMAWFARSGLRVYSAWPPVMPAELVDPPIKGVMHQLAMDPAAAGGAELRWLTHRVDDARSGEVWLERSRRLSALLEDLVRQTADVTASSRVDPGSLAAASERLLEGVRAGLGTFPQEDQPEALLGEVLELFNVLATGDVERVASFLSATRHLFRGANGVGLNFFVAYREEPGSVATI